MIPSLHRSDVRSYSPFGTVLEERNWSTESYRYGFNGKEKDNEGMGGGSQTYDYGFRIYNASLGRFLSVDPLSHSFPYYSTYQFAGNMPIVAVDLDGLEAVITVNSPYISNEIVKAYNANQLDRAIALATNAIHKVYSSETAIYAAKTTGLGQTEGSAAASLNFVESNTALLTVNGWVDNGIKELFTIVIVREEVSAPETSTEVPKEERSWLGKIWDWLKGDMSGSNHYDEPQEFGFVMKIDGLGTTKDNLGGDHFRNRRGSVTEDLDITELIAAMGAYGPSGTFTIPKHLQNAENGLDVLQALQSTITTQIEKVHKVYDVISNIKYLIKANHCSDCELYFEPGTGNPIPKADGDKLPRNQVQSVKFNEHTKEAPKK